MAPESVLITGGVGFLGSWIVKALQEQLPDLKLIVLDCRKPKDWNPNIDFVETDITIPEAVLQVFEIKRPTAVIHSAGIVPTVKNRYKSTKEAANLVYLVNVNGTKSVLDAARATGVKYFVYTSSTTVILDDPSMDHPNMTEDLPTGRATLTYGRTKGIAEALVLEANDSTKFRTCYLRPSVIFGPGDYNTIPTIHSCIAKGETPYVIGDPTSSLYDLAYVGNVADAHVLVLRNLMSTGTASGRQFFITNAEPLPFRDFCLAVWREFGHIPRYQIHLPLSVAWFAGMLAEAVTWVTRGETTLSRGSVRDYTMTAYCDISNARSVLGYEPKVGMEEGIKLSCEVSMQRSLNHRLAKTSLRI